MLYKKYQLLLSGGQLTSIISDKETAVKLWQYIQDQNGTVKFFKVDVSCTKVTEFVTDSKHIIGIDDIFPDDRIDFEGIEKRKKILEENLLKQKNKRGK